MQRVSYEDRVGLSTGTTTQPNPDVSLLLPFLLRSYSHDTSCSRQMTSIVVTRTAPAYSPITSMTFTSTDIMADLISSLSGDLAEYRFVASAPGQIVLAAVDSYKVRFRRTNAELEKVVEENRKLEQDRQTLRRAHLYTKILAGKPLTAYAPFYLPNHLLELHDVWWWLLPEHVVWAFVRNGRYDRTFSL